MASCTRISGIFFQKIGYWPLGCVGSARLALLPDTVGQMQLMPCSSAMNFWKNIPENRASKLHICKAVRPLTTRENSPGSSKPHGRGGAAGPGPISACPSPQPSPHDYHHSANPLSRTGHSNTSWRTVQRKVSQPAWLAIPAACSWSSKCACESSPRTGSCNVRTLGT
jgi:hypothetical protein